jgi:iron-sulfur cluster repair protein YtfE (RIC family)
MKRDEALAPLSRDHHGSLILAQLLKKDAPVYRELPTEPWDKAKYAQQQFEEHIKNHFHKEEEMLDRVKGCHQEVTILAEEIRNEHQQLAALFSSLTNSTDLVNTLDKLAVTLQDHIRKEERVLFPLLQQYCSAEQLQEIHELLH